jgi:hypothetical protein
VEVFPAERLDGPDAAFYRSRLARVPKAPTEQTEVVDSRLLRRRGESVVVVRHPWDLESSVEIELSRPPNAPFLAGRLPEGRYQPGDVLSIQVAVPKAAADEDVHAVRLGPGNREIQLVDTGRHRNRIFRTSPRFELAPGETGEIEVRIPAAPEDSAEGFRLQVYRWRPPAAANP